MSHSASAGLRRVVVTGVGLVSPIGVGTDETWQGILAGRSGIAPITLFDAVGARRAICRRGERVRPAAVDRPQGRQEVRALHPVRHRRDRHGRHGQRPGGWAPTTPTRVGVVIGSGIGGFEVIEREHRVLLEKGPERVSPFFILSSIVNLAAGQVSVRLGAKGPNSAVATACTTGAHAIGDGFRLVQRGLRRRDDLRWHRGQHHAAWHRRLCRDARALDAQRRARPRQPSLGHRP